jgi:MFS family permease
VNQPDPRRWAALAVLCTANFMVILDSQFVLLALPSIDRALGLADGNAQWALTAYMLSFGGLLLLGGRVADLAGRRRVFLGGTALFLVSSLLCGLAWTPATLIGARVLQGVSAALMAPSALSLVLTTFPDGAERNRAIAAWSSVGGIGATAALIVGGALTRALGWPWVFFLNVPVAAGLLLAGAGLLRESRERTARGFDVTGAVTVTAALTCGLLALTRAPEAGWTSPWTLVLLAVSVGLFLVFAATERRSAARSASPHCPQWPHRRPTARRSPSRRHSPGSAHWPARPPCGPAGSTSRPRRGRKHPREGAIRCVTCC